MIFNLLPDEKLFYKRNHERLHEKNRSELIVITGDTGSGKSYAGMRQGEIVTDSKFMIPRDCKFLPSEFMSRIATGGRYCATMLDDSGIAFNAREFMSKSNKLLSLALESCRFKNQTLILTIPDLAMIDINARRLMNELFWMIFINAQDKYSCATWYEISNNPVISKVYRKHPKFEVNGELMEKDTMRIRKPDDALIEDYEREKKDFLDPLYIDFVEELAKIEEKWKGVKKRREREKERVSEAISEVIT